jgi:hypothetical protein
MSAQLAVVRGSWGYRPLSNNVCQTGNKNTPQQLRLGQCGLYYTGNAPACQQNKKIGDTGYARFLTRRRVPLQFFTPILPFRQSPNKFVRYANPQRV